MLAVTHCICILESEGLALSPIDLQRPLLWCSGGVKGVDGTAEFPFRSGDRLELDGRLDA